jgi:uncharacterized membrane protein YcgQ (UPF0703/DUF1980 family)
MHSTTDQGSRVHIVGASSSSTHEELTALTRSGGWLSQLALLIFVYISVILSCLSSFIHHCFFTNLLVNVSSLLFVTVLRRFITYVLVYIFS